LPPPSQIENDKTVLQSTTDFFKNQFDQINASAMGSKKTFSDVGKAAKYFGETLTKGVGQAAGSAFASFGAALVNGENAFDAFLASFLSALGQMMIQQGTAFILQGLGFSVIPGLQASGGTLIAAGTALAVAGGALTAFSAGMGTSPAATAASGGGGVAGGLAPEGEFQPEDEEIERGTSVTVNVQGDVLDSDESGIRIVDVINKAFDKQGVTINQGLA
jgi:hypothetical protein